MLDTGDLECLGRVNLAAVWGSGHGVCPTGHQARDIGKRNEVAGGGDRAPERQAWCHVGVEKRSDRLEDLEADAGVPLEQSVDADEYRRPRCSSW